MKNQFEWGNQCGTNLNRKNHQKEMNFLGYRGGEGDKRGEVNFFQKNCWRKVNSKDAMSSLKFLL